jgi:hypothetical protein
LKGNWKRLRDGVLDAAGTPQAARAEPYKSLSDEHMDALAKGVRALRVTVELRLTETTSTPTEGSRSNSVLSKLRAELKAAFDGRDVLDVHHPRTIDPMYVKAATQQPGGAP